MNYPSGQYVTYGYDRLDRLVQEVYYNSDGSVQAEYQYIYNADGQLAKQQAIRNGAVVESYHFEYDSLGRLIRSREENGSSNVQRTEHLYDTKNRLTTQSWTMGSKSFYENYYYRPSDGALNRVTEATGDTVSFGYDALKRVSTVTTKNYANKVLLTQSNTYQNFETINGETRTSTRLSTYTVKGANNQTIVGNRYSYDANGNITKIEEANGSGYRVTAQYTYDGLNQLTKETRYTYSGTSTTAATTTVVDYSIDTAGNLRSVTTTVNGTQTDQISYTYGNTAWADKLTAVTVNGTKKTISYADTLNPKSWYNGTSYTNLTWTQGRRLSSITKGNQTYSYEYDMSGVRSAKVVNGERHEYVTQNGRVVRDYVTYAGTDTFVRCTDFFYDEAGRPFAMRSYFDATLTGANTFHYVLNAQGDVMQLIYQGGTVYAEYSYDTWGNVTSIKGSSTGDMYYANLNPLRYRGYYYDTETGFYYLQSRYYDPAVKRFLNADSYASTGQGFTGYNMFAYCGNNPNVRFDPNGTGWLGALISGGISFVSTLVTGGSFEEACENALVSGIAGAVGGNWGRIIVSGYNMISTWAAGGSFIDGLESGAISYCTSFVAGDEILGGNADEAAKVLIDVTYGFAADVIGTALDKSFVQPKESSPKEVASTVTNNETPSGLVWPSTSHAGGGGGGVWRAALQ